MVFFSSPKRKQKNKTFIFGTFSALVNISTNGTQTVAKTGGRTAPPLKNKKTKKKLLIKNKKKNRRRPTTQQIRRRRTTIKDDVTYESGKTQAESQEIAATRQL